MEYIYYLLPFSLCSSSHHHRFDTAYKHLILRLQTSTHLNLNLSKQARQQVRVTYTFSEDLMSRAPPSSSSQADKVTLAHRIFRHLQRLDLTDRTTRRNLKTVRKEHHIHTELWTFMSLLQWNKALRVLGDTKCGDSEAYDLIRLLPDLAGLLRRLRRHCPVSSQPSSPLV